MSTQLVSEESSRLIQEVRSFIDSTIVEIEIKTEAEKVNAVTLGNELQKKYSVIEKARKTEKSVWDAKAKAVQDEFVPTLQLITTKKNALGSAITAYDRKIEIERQERQRQLEDQYKKERARLEAFAGKREERRAMYLKKLEETLEKMKGAQGDNELYTILASEARYYEAKVEEFTEKAAETQQRAAAVLPPIYKPEAPVSSQGTRRTMEATVQLTDMRIFAAWCVEHNECQYLAIDEAKLKNRIKEREGKVEMPGLVCSWTPKTGFSGR
jgi:hypothetical protein